MQLDIVFSEKLTPIYFIYFTSEFIDIIFGEDVFYQSLSKTLDSFVLKKCFPCFLQCYF